MFIITHVLIIKGPPKYEKETKKFELKLHEVDKLPKGFILKPGWGDYFLKYKDDGTILTTCMRHFFQKTKKGWKRWPQHDRKSPEQDIAELMAERRA
jgi:hypothetical protein